MNVTLTNPDAFTPVVFPLLLLKQDFSRTPVYESGVKEKVSFIIAFG